MELLLVASDRSAVQTVKTGFGKRRFFFREALGQRVSGQVRAGLFNIRQTGRHAGIAVDGRLGRINQIAARCGKLLAALGNACFQSILQPGANPFDFLQAGEFIGPDR